MIKEPDSRLKILPEDLGEKELYKVNQVVSDLYAKIDSVRINGKFYGKSQFEDIWMDTNRDPANLDGAQVLNLRELRRLGLNPTTNTVRITGGGGGGGGGSSSTRVQYPPAVTYLDAVSRLISEKVGETISVLDFGAVADAGVTDNSPAFNAAIQAAIYSGRGKRILIPAAPTGSWYGCLTKISVNNRYYLHGTVSTSGTTVTLDSGDNFPSYIGAGWTITIDSVDYTVSSRTSDTELELTTTPTGDPLTGVTYSAISTALVPIAFEGEGDLSIVKRGANLGAGEGLFDIQGENITFHNFLVDGDVTTPTGLQYGNPGDFNNDPMSASLTTNTSFWVHGPSKDVSFIKMTVTHTGGYSILLDATNGSNLYDSGNYDIKNTKVLFSNFLNNRPHLFGYAGPASYGSWTGGIFLNTYGIQTGANYLSTVYSTLIQGCYFEGNTGNCVWSHLYGFDVLFSDLRVLGNTFIDNGLDCILFGGVTGGACIGNRTRRTGYIATNTSADVGPSNPTVPKWLSGLNATAIDTSGICKNVTYANNSIISTNGGDMDLDGFCDGQVIGNVCMTPRSYDPEYVEDSISSTGPPGYPGKYSYGVQPSNSYGGNWGGLNISITGNSFINKDGGAIRLAACRNGYISGNYIWHPPSPSYAPIILFNIGTGSTQRTYDTVVTNNSINYDPTTQRSAIEEWGAALGYPAFQPGDKNWIHANQVIGDCYEFYKDADTDSTTGVTISMSHSALSAKSDTFITRKRSVVTNGNYDYLLFNYNYGSSDVQTAYLSDHAIVGIGGYVNTSGTAVTWVSGDKFASFANGDIIRINGVNYTISTVNSDTSITLTGSAGTQTATTFLNPVYKWGAPFFNVGDSLNGSISTGNRSVLGFDDVMATNVFAGDGFLSLTDTLIDDEKANKLPDTYGLLKYDSAAKVFKISNSATLGVRVWTTLGSGGGSPGGADKYVQINDAGSFGGFDSFTFNKTTKLLTLTGAAGTPTILAATGYIQSNGGFLSQVDAYNAFQSSFGDGAAFSGLQVSDYYPNGTVDTVGTAVTRSSGSLFTAAMVGNAITINGVNYTVATYVNANSITLTGSAGTQTGVTYSSLAGNRGGYIYLNRLTTGSFPNVLTGASFSASDPLLWVSSTNGTSSPVTAVGINTNSFINAAAGFYSGNTATDTIQAPYGGVYGKWLITSNSVFWLKVPSGTVNTSGTAVTWVSGTSFLGFSAGDTIKINGVNYTVSTVNSSTSITLTGSAGTQSGTTYSMVVPVSGSGQARTYLDPTTGLVMISQNGSAYTAIASSSPAGSDGYVQYNVSGALSANVNFYYDTVKNFLSLGGETASANITARLFVKGSGHFWEDTSNQIVILSRGAAGQTGNLFEAQDNSANALFAIEPGGGAYFRTSGSPTLYPGLGLLYYDTASNKFKVSQNGAAAVDLLGGSSSAAGSTGYVQYNTAGAFDANVNLFWDSALGRLSLGGTTSSITARLYVRGAAHIWADGSTQTVVLAKGTASQSGNLFEAQDNGGSAFWALAPNGGMYFRSVSTPAPSGTTGILYFDGTNFRYTEGASGPFLLSGVKSLNGLTGTLSVVAGTSISVSAAGSSVTVATVQDISTSASPSFVGATLNNATGLSLKNATGTARKVLSLESTNDLYLDNISDGNIYIRPISSGFIVLGRDPSVSSSVIPNGDNRVTLGNSSNGWTNVYARSYFYWNGSSYVAGVFGGVSTVSAGSGISVSGTTSVTITNTGVTSLTAGTGIGLTASTGSITVSIGQSVATTAAVSFNSTTYANGTSNGVYIKNTGGTAINRINVASDNNLYIDNQDSGSGDIYIRPYYSGVPGTGRFVVIGVSGNYGGLLPYGGNMTLGNSGNPWATIYGSAYYVGSTSGKTASFSTGGSTYYFTNGILTLVTTP